MIAINKHNTQKKNEQHCTMNNENNDQLLVQNEKWTTITIVQCTMNYIHD